MTFYKPEYVCEAEYFAAIINSERHTATYKEVFDEKMEKIMLQRATCDWVYGRFYFRDGSILEFREGVAKVIK